MYRGAYAALGLCQTKIIVFVLATFPKHTKYILRPGNNLPTSVTEDKADARRNCSCLVGPDLGEAVDPY